MFDVKSYYIDFFYLNLSIAVTQAKLCEDIQEYEDINNRMAYLVNNINLVNYTDRILNMAKEKNIETENFVALADIVNYQFSNSTFIVQTVKQFLLLFFFIIPLVFVEF